MCKQVECQGCRQLKESRQFLLSPALGDFLKSPNTFLKILHGNWMAIYPDPL